MRGAIFRIQSNRFAKFVQRCVPPAAIFEYRGFACVRRSVLGLQAQRLPVLRRCVIDSADLAKRRTQMDASLYQVGLQPQRLDDLLDCAVSLPEAEKYLTQVIVRVR